MIEERKIKPDEEKKKFFYMSTHAHTYICIKKTVFFISCLR